jgi:hypothetical protein
MVRCNKGGEDVEKWYKYMDGLRGVLARLEERSLPRRKRSSWEVLQEGRMLCLVDSESALNLQGFAKCSPRCLGCGVCEELMAARM